VRFLRLLGRVVIQVLKGPSSLSPRSVSLSRGRGARARLDRRPPDAAGAVAGLGLRERAAQSNLNRRARPTRGHRRLSLSPYLRASRATRVTREAPRVHAACDTSETKPPSPGIDSSARSFLLRAISHARAREREIARKAVGETEEREGKLENGARTKGGAIIGW